MSDGIDVLFKISLLFFRITLADAHSQTLSWLRNVYMINAYKYLYQIDKILIEYCLVPNRIPYVHNDLI